MSPNHVNNHSAAGTAAAAFTLVLALIASALVAPPASRAGGARQDVEKLNRFIQSSDSSSPASKAFRKGRDFIEEEDWEEASEAFSNFISEYPNEKNVDAALYWLAFALKKQNRIQEVGEVLSRLVKGYPKSNWIDDAKAMQVEIAAKQGDTKAITEALEGGAGSSEDESRIIALQGLLEADPARAAAYVADVLKPGSQASRKLKENVISLLGQNGGKQAKETLVQVARAPGDPRVRKNAIFWLGQTSDEDLLVLLKELAMSPDDEEISKAAIFSISQHRSPHASRTLSEMARSAPSQRIRKEAIFWIGQRGGEAGVDELFGLLGSDDEAIQKQVIFSLSMMRNQRAKDRLREIARSSPDPSLRREAIFWVGQNNSDESAGFLAQLYDEERDEETKKKIILSLGQNRAKRAVRKLIEIARGDSSAQLRKDAVFWLGSSNDPEARKFIEDMLK